MTNKLLSIFIIITFSISAFGAINNTEALDLQEKKAYDNIFNLLKHEKYKRAYDLLLILGKSGDEKAMLALGNLHYEGKGVMQNYKEAYKWYRKSLNSGSKQVKYVLANMYKDGIGTDRAYYRAFDLYLQSAIETNNPKAMFFTSAMYYHGEGVKRNFQEAYKWAKKAIKQKEPRAAFLLGLMYLNGFYIKQDFEQAFYYANMSHSLGNQEAPKLIELITKESLKSKTKKQ